MFQTVRRWFSRDLHETRLQEQLAKLREQTPVPVFWLFGKTQSGKTSLVRFLTGAEDAEIGQGFRPCTRYSREYQFPTTEAPLITFLDTRGTDEPDYDPDEDLALFGEKAHVVLVTVRILDHAQEKTLRHLQKIRRARPSRPVILVLTCLHEAYPQQQHPQPYPFELPLIPGVLPEAAARSIQEQLRRFEKLFDRAVAVDLTPHEEGFADPNYGGDHLRQTLLDTLPEAFRQTLLRLEACQEPLRELFARRALPHIIGYSTLATTAGAMPIPWLDLLILPGIQSQMINHLARLYGQPLSAARFLEIAGTLGTGMLLRQASREAIKFIPFVGSVANGIFAGASTYALGKAFCYYYSKVHQGHVPSPEDLKKYYHEQLQQAEKFCNPLPSQTS
jgi:uncharacterized protein (DUF697 family)/predicted GTPase